MDKKKNTGVLISFMLLIMGVTTSQWVVADGSYHFDLTKGAGTPVCDAYLKRLNTTDYVVPPYCDRPETTSVPGFTLLHRVPLAAVETKIMSLRVTDFINAQRQRSPKEYKAEREANDTWEKSSPTSLLTTEKMLQHGDIVAWHYDPPVDIDNGGKPDDVLVWRGHGVTGYWPSVCGQPSGSTQFETDGRVPQVAFILAQSNDRLDVPINIARTNEIFGHPSGGYHYPGQSFPDIRFRPMGPTIGIFKYQDLYYFDTFLFNHPVGSWGFLTNKREYNPKRANTLAVFLRQHGKTRQICEYHMTESITSNSKVEP